MEVFYQAWGVVQQVINADAKLPREAALPRQADRQVARYLADRRAFSVLDIIEALGPLSQPELLRTQAQEAELVSRREIPQEVETGAVVAPAALDPSQR